MTTVAFRFCTGMDTFSSDLIYLALCLQHLAKRLPAKTEALSDTFEKEQKQRLLQETGALGVTEGTSYQIRC